MPQAESGAASQVWTSGTTDDPSPAAAATRFIDPERTSPTANTPGTVVARLAGGTAPIVLNAANEVMVAALLCRRILYGELASLVAAVLERLPVEPAEHQRHGDPGDGQL